MTIKFIQDPEGAYDMITRPAKTGYYMVERESHTRIQVIEAETMIVQSGLVMFYNKWKRPTEPTIAHEGDLVAAFPISTLWIVHKVTRNEIPHLKRTRKPAKHEKKPTLDPVGERKKKERREKAAYRKKLKAQRAKAAARRKATKK